MSASVRDYQDVIALDDDLLVIGMRGVDLVGGFIGKIYVQCKVVVTLCKATVQSDGERDYFRNLCRQGLKVFEHRLLLLIGGLGREGAKDAMSQRRHFLSDNQMQIGDQAPLMARACRFVPETSSDAIFSCYIYKHDDHNGGHTTNDASRTIP